MKKILSLLLAMIMVLSMVACAGGESDFDDDDDEDEASETVSDNKTREEISGTSAFETVENPKSEESEKNETKEKLAGYVYDCDASGHYRTTSDICNEYGETTYTFLSNETVHVYANGFFISEIGGVFYLKDHTGKEITSSKKLSVSGFGMLENSAFLEGGYVMAYVASEAYNGTTYKMGILNTAGKWVLPLSDDYALLNCGVTLSKEFFTGNQSTGFSNLHYAGEGCLIVDIGKLNRRYDYAIYNFQTDKMHYYENLIDEYGYLRAMDYFNIIREINFEDGFYRYVNDGEVFEFYPDGTLNYRKIAMEYNDYGHYEKNGIIYLCGSDGWGTVFGNSRDGVTRDFHDEGIKIANVANLRDGRWFLGIVNNENSYYYTIADYTGKFLFEPIKTDCVYILHESGIGVCANDNSYTSDQGYGEKIVIDDKGSVLYTCSDPEKEIYVQNGVIREYTRAIMGGTAEYEFLKKN